MTTRIRITTVAATALLCGLTPATAAADISGKWTATFDTQIGEQKYT